LAGTKVNDAVADWNVHKPSVLWTVIASLDSEADSRPQNASCIAIRPQIAATSLWTAAVPASFSLSVVSLTTDAMTSITEESVTIKAHELRWPPHIWHNPDLRLVALETNPPSTA
jgi:hypothetical protein